MAIFINLDEYKTKPIFYFPAYECEHCHKIYINGKRCPKCKSENRREIFTTIDKLNDN